MTSPRPSAPPPYFSPGQQVLWHYRRPGWAPGDAQFVFPVTVVHDDVDALVAWLPVGTPYLAARREDGAAAVEAVVASWGHPSCDGWESFRPDPDWPLPGLPRIPRP